jgi:PIN domain nuclease of toxin-antitoxin system
MNGRLLLDSYILLWWLMESSQLTKLARKSIVEVEAVFVSAASAWELTIKAAVGKLKTPDDLEAQVRASQFIPLSISLADSSAAGNLPRHHGDPFDRMLVAQASLESLTLLTSDARLQAYGIPVILA